MDYITARIGEEKKKLLEESLTLEDHIEKAIIEGMLIQVEFEAIAYIQESYCCEWEEAIEIFKRAKQYV